MKLLVIDTETTGTDPRRHGLLTLAAIVWSDGSIGDEIELAVASDGAAIDPEAMAVNRIDLAEHARLALPPALAADRLTAFVARHFDVGSKVEPAVLCGHNVAFDVGFLKQLFDAADRPFERWFSHRTLDTASVLRFLALAGRVPPEAVGSTGAFAYFGIGVDPALRHSALADARATAELLNRLIETVRAGG